MFCHIHGLRAKLAGSPTHLQIVRIDFAENIYDWIGEDYAH